MRTAITHDRAEPRLTGLLLPEGTRLVHIGPPKTGTTSLQSAFHAARQAVAAQGVHYAGARRSPMNATRALADLIDPTTGKPPSPKVWRDLVREVRRSAAARTVISSEYLSRAGLGAVRTLATDLGPDAVHVVATLRSLTRVLPSQWQQSVRNGATASYDAWLTSIFDSPGSKAATSFWLRHRHDALVARWAEVVGPDRVTVVVVDEDDQTTILRVFERFLGLSVGTLTAVPDLSNRSLSLPEIELLRAFNRRYWHEGLGRPLYQDVVTRGAAFYMKAHAPAPGDPRIETPDWAVERATPIAREIVDAIRSSGVRVVGELDDLLVAPASSGRAAGSVIDQVSVEMAVTAAMGVLVGSGVTGLPADRGHDDHDERTASSPIENASTRQLLGTLTRRGRAALGYRLRGVGRLVRRSPRMR